MGEGAQVVRGQGVVIRVVRKWREEIRKRDKKTRD